MAVSPKSGAESKAFSMSWAAAPAPCTNPGTDAWSGVHHYEVHRRTAPLPSSFTSPSGYDSGASVGSVGAGTTSFASYVHRPGAQFSYRVYACEDAGCTSRYGDGSGNSKQ